MNENISHRFNQWLRQSITIKLIAVGFIALLLLIPLQFAVSLISERGDRQQEVVEKINNSWGEGISLTLFVFLVIQLVSTRYIHPLQYFLIGLALVTFYTLLLSVTEHSNFLVGYLVSAGAVVLLISIYAVSLLKSKRASLVVFFCLALLYSFVYTIIQLEDYALLVGSAGIFLILATIMYVTRNLDWTARAGSNP